MHLKIIITFVTAISKVGFVYSLDLGIIVNRVKLHETINNTKAPLNGCFFNLYNL